MLAIPVILAEEVEKKTFDALVMIASYWDVIIGKALVGIVYTAVAILLTVTIVQLQPQDVLWFGLGLGLLTICLIGFGLWIGGFFKSANQLNTWSGVIMIPVILPASLIAVPAEITWLDWILRLFPTSQAARLTANGIAGETIFTGQALGVAVLVVWSIIGYALLYFQLQRRQA
jgi:ABC-2 type transport system permease protein